MALNPRFFENFLAWSLDHAARAGYAEAAKPRDYFIGCQVGMLTHADVFEPTRATPYFLVVGERAEGKIRWYTTWKELYHKTFEVVDRKSKRLLTIPIVFFKGDLFAVVSEKDNPSVPPRLIKVNLSENN